MAIGLVIHFLNGEQLVVWPIKVMYVSWVATQEFWVKPGLVSKCMLDRGLWIGTVIHLSRWWAYLWRKACRVNPRNRLATPEAAVSCIAHSKMKNKQWKERSLNIMRKVETGKTTQIKREKGWRCQKNTKRADCEGRFLLNTDRSLPQLPWNGSSSHLKRAF